MIHNSPHLYAPPTTALPNAVFSDNREHRFLLQRRLRPGKKTCVFICLNPSTADEKFDDATIRRCKRYVYDWGYDKLIMGNLYSYRATDPKDLIQYGDDDVSGLDNIHWLLYLLEVGNKPGNIVVVGWGNNGDVFGKASHLKQDIKHRGYKVHCLGITKKGEPMHPSRLNKDLTPFEYDLTNVPDIVYPDVGLI